MKPITAITAALIFAASTAPALADGCADLEAKAERAVGYLSAPFIASNRTAVKPGSGGYLESLAPFKAEAAGKLEHAREATAAYAELAANQCTGWTAARAEQATDALAFPIARVNAALASAGN